MHRSLRAYRAEVSRKQWCVPETARKAAVANLVHRVTGRVTACKEASAFPSACPACAPRSLLSFPSAGDIAPSGGHSDGAYPHRLGIRPGGRGSRSVWPLCLLLTPASYLLNHVLRSMIRQSPTTVPWLMPVEVPIFQKTLQM